MVLGKRKPDEENGNETKDEEREPESDDDVSAIKTIPDKNHFKRFLPVKNADQSEQPEEREAISGEEEGPDDYLDSDIEEANLTRILEKDKTFSLIFLAEQALQSLFLIPDKEITNEDREILNVMSIPEAKRNAIIDNWVKFRRNVLPFDGLIEKWNKGQYLVSDFFKMGGRFDTGKSSVKHVYNINLNDYRREE